MVLNYLTSKDLGLYGIVNTFDGYTVDKDTQLVTINVEIAFNLSDIESKIASVEQDILALEAEEETDSMLKMHQVDDLQEVLEVLTVLRDKLNG